MPDSLVSAQPVSVRQASDHGRSPTCDGETARLNDGDPAAEASRDLSAMGIMALALAESAFDRAGSPSLARRIALVRRAAEAQAKRLGADHAHLGSASGASRDGPMQATRAARPVEDPAQRLLLDRIQHCLEGSTKAAARTLVCLLDRAGDIVPFQVVMDAIETRSASRDIVKVYINQLRHSLRRAGFDDVIVTVRGKGYGLKSSCVGPLRHLIDRTPSADIAREAQGVMTQA